MEEQTFSAGDGDYLWIVVDQAKIDDPSQVDESGSNVASFKVGLHPPLSENVLVLGQCKYDVETETSYVEVITKEISNIEDMFVQEANS
ncbi:MAG: hypothetical protein LBU27_02960 [Candidatus Peribacteria bacterium]|jgi:hypothetical protein|nr:hypothetical protein [Candidatus Peribacteria bacterium]